MPEPSNPIASPHNTAPTFAPRNRLRLHKALRTIKLFATVFVLAFVCAYARTYLRYGTPHAQPQASLTQLFTQTDTSAPSSPTPRRIPVRHVKRHRQHSSPYHLATLRRLRRYLYRVLDVRS